MRRRGTRLGAAALAALAAPAAACSRPTDVLPRDGVCAAFQVLDVSPADGALEVSPSVIPTFTFSDFPDPNTVNGQNFLVTSGPYYFAGRESVDSISRQVRFQTSSRLPTGLGFTLVLAPKVQSLRGCPMAPPPVTEDGRQPDNYTFSFRTVEPNVPTPPPDPVPAPATFEQALGVFAAHCAGGGCHVNDATAAAAIADADADADADAPDADVNDGGGGEAASDDTAACAEAAAGGLSLCARDAYAALVGVPSQEVSRLVRVAPRDSARSYLLRKLLGAPPFAGHTNPSEVPLSEDDLRVIASWIDAGATTTTPSALR